MNLLEFGMKNRRNASLGKRAAAEAALAVEKFRADRLEKRMEGKASDAAADAEESARMLQKILQQADAKEESVR